MVALFAVSAVMGYSDLLSAQPARRTPPARDKDKSKDKSKDKTKDAPKRDGADMTDEKLFHCRTKIRRVSIAFNKELELKDLITWAMGFTCRNFIHSASINSRAKVVIIAPKTVSKYEAWRVFLAALRTMNMTIVPVGSVLKITEAKGAKSEALPLHTRGAPGSREQLVRAVIRPSHMSAQDLTAALNALKSGDGDVKEMGKTGMILVTDYASHISKMRYLVREIDQPVVGERLYFLKIRNGDVTEVANKLQEILGIKDRSSAASKPSSSKRRSRKKKTAAPKATAAEVEVAVPSKVIADERTNALIVLASEAAYLRVRSLVKVLDSPVEVEGAGRIHVYYLENADAEELGNTLNTVVSGVSQPSSRGNQRRGSARARPAPAASTAGAPAFEGQVRVSHDKPSNSLVIVASVKDFVALRQVIRRLDAPRRQVFIEATIFEVNVDNGLNIGASFHGGAPVGEGVAIGGFQTSGLSSVNAGVNPTSLLGIEGLLGALLGAPLEEATEILGFSPPSYGALVQLLATRNNLNVLSAPHIMTTDNEEAEISVGENIPYTSTVGGFTGGVPGAGGSGTTGGIGLGTSISRQDVALTLKITPHINATDKVRLEIDQEINDIAQRDFEGNGPSWSTRRIKTTVVVPDQQTVVIGGLMKELETFDEKKIPLLGDLPLLGYLFKTTRKSKSKTNLLIMLTPYVIKDQLDIERVVRRKIDERNEFTRAFTRLSKVSYRPNIDYRRKRGLIAEISHSVKQVEYDREQIRLLDRKLVEIPDGPIEYNEEDDAPESSAPPEGTSKPNADAKESADPPAATSTAAKSGTDESDDKDDDSDDPGVAVVPTYRVERGDTLGEIARRFGTTVQVLVKLNNIKNVRRLRIGQVLKLPGGGS